MNSNIDPATSKVDEAQRISRERLDLAWKSLRTDMNRWLAYFRNQQAKSESKPVIAHHIEQYVNFSLHAYNLLQAQVHASMAHSTAQAGVASLTGHHDVDELEFTMLVIGILSARWALLRQIALQRMESSPYSSALTELDRMAEQYYHRLRMALPETLREREDRPIAPFAPIVYLGNLAGLTVYNQRAPLVLSIPFGAVDLPEAEGGSNSHHIRQAIPHEVAHAILVQVPEIRSELQEKLPKVLEKRAKTASARQRLLYGMIANWLEEILADLIGCALVGDDYFYSAVFVMTTVRPHSGAADTEHPPSLIRPYIHKKTLEFLQKGRESQKRGVALKQLSDYIEAAEDPRTQYLSQIVGSQMGQPFKSMPAITYITLGEVRNELEEAVDCVLEDESLRLHALRLDKKRGSSRWTVGDLLRACDESITVASQSVHTPWGEIPDEQTLPFALDLAGGLAPDFHLPIADFDNLPKIFCENLGWILGSFCPSK
ncbi:MAG: hypothetical protein DCC55_02290 [Chloroflexi bacterium]|nr:MAG: hypothetical protein DCC55_02290 [Chloroflexota bacterium]